MEKVSPYITLDIQLEHLEVLDEFPRIGEAGYYCVFWWKEIPLGQLFIEKNQAPSKKLLLEKIINVIKPTIDFYIHLQRLNNAEYKKDFIENNQHAFNLVMENIFSGLLPRSLPGTVDVSVVICTRNRSVHLKTCIERLKQQKCFPVETIVVDNAPADDSTRRVVEQYPEITYLLEPRPGLDIARNAGAKISKASIVAYVDDDVIVHPLWTYRIWESFLPAEITAVTGLVIAEALDTEAQQIFEKFWSFNRGYEDKIYDSEFFRNNLKDGPPVWEIGAGANMAFRKSVFEQVGYFDERLDVGAAGCSGDSEMWFRILANGGSILYTPRPVVYHQHRRDLKKLHHQLFYYMRGFAAAALIQQEHYKEAGYKNRLFRQLPKSYFQMLISAFPRYSFQNKTLLSEIRGVISGIRFYHKTKNKPS